MKKLFTLAVLLFIFSTSVKAQNNVGINTPSPDASAALDVTSTTQGVLVPRMSKSQRDEINTVNGVSTPATGLLVYQTDDTPGFYFYNGSSWTSLNGQQGATLPSQSGNSGKFLTTDGTALSWASSSGAKLELVVRKTAATQSLVVSTSANPDLVIYDNVTTAPTVGSYNTSTNTYTAGSAGLYLIQTRNSMVDNSSNVNNTVGAYNYLEVNGSSYGSMQNIYPTYVSNGSIRSTTNSAIKSSTQYMFLVVLNANDTLKIKATSLNSAVSQVLNNDGGTQLMVVKL